MSNKIQPVFQGSIKDGVFIPLDEYKKIRLDRWMQFLEGKNVEMVLRIRHNKRSRKQNDYYWSAIIPLIADAMGELDEQAVHDGLRWKFLRREDHQGFPVVRSTTSLTKGEFVEYMMNIEIWATEFFGITFPKPDEYDPVRMISDEEK